jgi:hypothetical protein
MPVNEALYKDLLSSDGSEVLAELGEFRQAVTGIPVFVMLIRL